MERVEAAKIALEERISERMCEQFGVVGVSKNSFQEDVEIAKIIPQEQMSGRTGEQIGVIEMRNISGQESVVPQVSLRSSLLKGMVNGSG